MISVALTGALMWLMIEYGLHVRISRKTWNGIRALLGMPPSDETRGKTGSKTPHSNMKEADSGKSNNEKYRETVTNSPIDQSNQKPRFRVPWAKSTSADDVERQEEQGKLNS